MPPALDALASYFTRMEQRFQDTGTYGAGGCALAVPTVANFTLSCTLGAGGTSFTATATGTGPMSGYAYTIDDRGTRATTAHPKGAPGGNCWSVKGQTCDA
ncbi:MAG: fimbrial assembly protein [Rubrivivax sp.]|nr:fimbrial assembly protein [Rubrivivax sp.]